MRIVITGSRSWTEKGVIRARFLVLPHHSTEIIVGGARGADTLAEEVAREQGLTVRVFPADWVKHGRAGGFVRNLKMLDTEPDKVIAFWDGESRGTKHTIDEAKRRGIPVEIITL